jgi:molybdenum cofactor cytidylyltransferase
MKITGAILAAGMSLRMGENKLLLKYKNHTVIAETVNQLSKANVNRVLVVTGFESARVEKSIAKYLTDRITIVRNRDYRLGRAESIKCAMRQIREDVDAALFMVADKPGVGSGLINRVVERFAKEQPAILYVRTPAGRGHPIIFARRLFDELKVLQGDLVGDELIARHKSDTVELVDENEQIDIDTKQDYLRLMKMRLS